MTNPIEFIHSCPPFNSLDEEALKLVVERLEIFEFPPGHPILTQGGPSSAYLYLIREGAVRLAHKGQAIDIIIGQGELFGYPSMLLHVSPSLDVISDEQIILYAIPEATFRQLLDRQAFAEFFLKDLSRRLNEAWEQDAPTMSGQLAHPAGSLIRCSPIFAPPEATAGEIARIMKEQGIGSVLIAAEPPGIVTSRDLCDRALAQGFGPEIPARQIMTQPLKSLPAETPIYGSLLFMLEERIDHLPLTDQGQIVGMITNGDLIRYQARSPLYLLRQLENLQSSKAVSGYSNDVTGTVETLFNDGLEVDQIGRIISGLNEALIKRLLKLTEAELGQAPTPYAWLVLGSEGRMEQTLLTDQDNALVYQDGGPDTDTYFKTLAERMVSKLIQVGFPPCPGGYMATNWSKPLSAWEKLFNSWVNVPDPKALLEAAIFFDIRAVYGGLSLASLEETVHKAKGQHLFLGHMARSALEFRPPLGLLWGFRDEDGQLDLKKGGIAPVVAMARVYALEAGSPARSSLERLQDAANAGVISREGATALTEALRYLLWLRLREQLREIKAGQTPDNKIHLDQLSAREKKYLRDAFLSIREMQEAIGRYEAHTL
jgi:CBS domain-containing protein